MNEPSLEGKLDLSDFINLVELNCQHNQLTSLKINNCSKLKKLDCSKNKLNELNLSDLDGLEEIQCHDNYLTNTFYPLGADKLTCLNISDIEIAEDLKSLTKIIGSFTNLEYLYLCAAGLE